MDPQAAIDPRDDAPASQAPARSAPAPGLDEIIDGAIGGEIALQAAEECRRLRAGLPCGAAS